MKSHNLISASILVTVALMAAACSDDENSSVIAPSEPSTAADLPTFSKLLAPFAASDEKGIRFDSHVMAYNTSPSSTCESAMVSYSENEEIIPIKPISKENIAECFPLTAPLLSNKFLAEATEAKFYAFITYMAESPQVLVLDKLEVDKISMITIYPGDNCIVDATGSIVMFLIADTDNAITKETISIIGTEIHSESWVCDEKHHFINEIDPYGEWINDSINQKQ
jgi:hypothetical protein